MNSKFINLIFLLGLIILLTKKLYSIGTCFTITSPLQFDSQGMVKTPPQDAKLKWVKEGDKLRYYWAQEVCE